jgi:hypothetical protein
MKTQRRKQRTLWLRNQIISGTPIFADLGILLKFETNKRSHSKGNIEIMQTSTSGDRIPAKRVAQPPRCYHWFHSFTATSDSDGIQSAVRGSTGVA